ncbi:MAG TPA: FtsQ-type POTRA domain-containing protein [Kofleriaceae bacterium]|nr:FtsQ-type POTRA domain-containing protein [Kofleriaceae bacterium]
MSRLVLRPNRKRTSPLIARLPTAREAIDGCGRALRRAVPAMIALLCAGTIGAGGWLGWRFLTTSPRFAVTAIEVRGAHAVPADELRALLPFAPGVNVFRIDTGAAEAALRRHPWVADVDVHRELPDTVVVDVRERRAAAVVAADGLYLVDADGRPFKKAELERGEGADLPIVSGVPRQLYADAPDEAAARVTRALAVLAAWNTGARPAAGEVHVDGRGATLYTWDDAVAVRLGAGDDAALAPRLARFDAAWAALTPEERRRTRAVHVDNDTRSDLVTVSFTPN